MVNPDIRTARYRVEGSRIVMLFLLASPSECWTATIRGNQMQFAAGVI